MHSPCTIALVSIAALVGIAAAGTPANADDSGDPRCECAHAPPVSITFMRPGMNEYAPANTRIWIIGRTGAFSMRDTTTGGAVMFTTSTIHAEYQQQDVVVLTPKAPLRVGGTFSVSAADEVLGEFTVIDEADTTAPEAPTVAQVARTTINACDMPTEVTVRLNAEGLILVRAKGAVDADLDTVAIEGSVLDATIRRDLNYGGLCQSWPSTTDALDLELATFDLAGNFSGWSARRIERTAPDKPGGCAVGLPRRAKPNAHTWTGLALATAALAKRRLVRRPRPT
jgi:hypothetical protein